MPPDIRFQNGAKEMLSAKPAFGVQLSSFAAQLELEDIVLSDAAESLAGADVLAPADVDTGQVAIDGDVAAMRKCRKCRTKTLRVPSES